MVKEVEERIGLRERAEGRDGDGSNVAGKGGTVNKSITSEPLFFTLGCRGNNSPSIHKVFVLLLGFKTFNGVDFDHVEELGVCVVVFFGEASFFLSNFFGSELEFKGES